MRKHLRNLYYLSEQELENEKTGIGYKIYMQKRLFIAHGFEVNTIRGFSNGKKINKIFSFLPFVNVRHNYKQIKALRDVDCIYIRYFFCNGKLIKTLKEIKKNNNGVKIFIEIPTFPYDGEIFCLHPKLIKDKISRIKLKKYVDRIVTFSDDNEIYGIKTLCISNGVDVDRIRRKKTLAQKEINIIAVAQLQFWHGYDRVIAGLHDYYENGGNEDFKIHIVGYGKKKVIKQYEDMIKKYNLSDRIIFYGKKEGTELDVIYDKCVLAFDSLGRHRSNVKYNSSLKGKEYLAKGIPIISGVETELDKDNFKYYLRVPANDAPINFFEVGTFYHSVYDNSDAEVVSQIIRDYCSSNFEFEKTFLPVIEEMNRLIERG